MSITHPAPLSTRILQGAGLAASFAIVRWFIGGEGFGPREGALLLLGVSVAGGAGGVMYYATDGWRVRGGLSKTAANVLSLIAYCFAASLLVYVFYLLGVLPK
jgi:hypothetical protein